MPLRGAAQGTIWEVDHPRPRSQLIILLDTCRSKMYRRVQILEPAHGPYRTNYMKLLACSGVMHAQHLDGPRKL